MNADLYHSEPCGTIVKFGPILTRSRVYIIIMGIIVVTTGQRRGWKVCVSPRGQHLTPINTSFSGFNPRPGQLPIWSSFSLALSVGAWWGWLVYTNLVTDNVYPTPKTICYPVCLEGTHESIVIQMYKHRSAPVITANKHKRTDTHTLGDYIKATLAAH